jgi:hypothetical protein
MAVICHYYPGITPLNVMDIDYELLKDLVKAIEKTKE